MELSIIFISYLLFQKFIKIIVRLIMKYIYFDFKDINIFNETLYKIIKI